MDLMSISHPPARRLTQLYSDTKHSCDAVIDREKIESLPELSTLQRKIAVQRSRLLEWGWEWADSSPSSKGDIDEPVARAGLTETVTSVLSTIKDMLDEAERMQRSGRAKAEQSLGKEKGMSQSGSQATWAASDISRYDDLVKDLTTAIDILYDVSTARRARQLTFQSTSSGKPSFSTASGKAESVFSAGSYSASEITLVNPATSRTNTNISVRSHLPPKLDPSTLILPEEEPPPYESIGVAPSARLIGRLRQQHTSANPWKSDGGKTVETPVLIEYANFDSTYKTTGVPPPTDRLDALLGLLVRLPTESARCGTLPCLGYFEDPEQPRFGLVYELPSSVYSGPADSRKPIEELRPATLLSLLQLSSKTMNAGSTTPPAVAPALEDRFRFAFTLAQAFSKIHGDSLVHRDVNSSNILLFRKQKTRYPISSHNKALDYELRAPCIGSFDLFSEYNIESGTMPPLNPYRHPSDPEASGGDKKSYGPQFDMYGLGLILLEVGFWIPLSDLFKSKYTLADFKTRIEEIWIRRLAAKCGTAYMQVVRDCFSAADRIASGATTMQSLGQIYSSIMTRLHRCCLLDEDDSSQEASASGMAPIPRAVSPSSKRKKAAQPNPFEEEGYSYTKRQAWDKSQTIISGGYTPATRLNLQQHLKAAAAATTAKHAIAFPYGVNMFAMPADPPVHEQMDWQPLKCGDATGDTRPQPVSSKSPTPSQDKLDIASLYKEGVSSAASIIQRAWRSRRDKVTFAEYRKKVMLIQKHWRRRQETLSSRSSTSQSSQQKDDAVFAYPTPEPDLEIIQRTITPESTIQIRAQPMPTSRPKLRIHPVKFPPSVTDEWHENVLPKLERIVGRVLRDSPETISIDLVAIGETPTTARPTIFITCTSTGRVKAALARKFTYDQSTFDLKVRKGKVRRSKLTRSTRKRRPAHRSMMNDESYAADVPALNPYHQLRPLCGASIGAFKDEHLPPVSYGGVILVDGEPLGMSVHHLLDEPSESEGDDSEFGEGPGEATRSSATGGSNAWLAAMGSQPGLEIGPEAMYPFEISDDDYSDHSDSDLVATSDYDASSDDDSVSVASSHPSTHGDIEGVAPGDGDDILITQPALDDVDDDFFPCPDDRDEDHLDSHTLGHVRASSGIRRWRRGGIVHEIDWALLQLHEDRLQPYNLVQGGRRFCPSGGPKLCPKLLEPVCRRNYAPEEDEYPVQVARAEELGSLAVHCFGRTSGLKGGMVSAAMSAVRIYGRKSLSRSWHVLGGFGVGGDSGAWVIDNARGRVCGHVLAWCERNMVAYICPMEVLLEDIKRTLGARKVCLPGAEELAEDEDIVTRQDSGAALEAYAKKMSFELPDMQRLNLGEAQGRVKLAMGESAGAGMRVLGGRAEGLA